jgi:WD40 repeat protein
MLAGIPKGALGRILIAWLALAALPAGSRADTPGITPILALDAAGHTGWITQLLLLPSYEPRLISTGHDKAVRFWDLASGEPLKTWRPAVDRGEVGAIYAAALSPDGHLLAIAGRTAQVPAGEQVILIVDPDSDAVVRSLRAISGPIRGLAFSPDGHWLAACSDDAVIRLWDPHTGRLTRELRGHTDRVYALAFSPDGRRLVSGSWDATSRLWSIPDGASLAVMPGQVKNVMRVAWSPDGRTIATGGAGPAVFLYEPDGRFRYAWNNFGTGVSGDSKTSISLLEFSPDSRTLLAGWASRVHPVKAAVVLDMTDGHVHYQLPKLPASPMCGLFLPGGSQYAVGYSSGDILFYSSSDGHVVRTLRPRARSHVAVGWSPDGRAIAWGDSNNRGSGIKGTHPLAHAFCLETLDMAPPPDANYQRSIGNWGEWSIQRVKNSVVRVDRGNMPVSRFKIPERDDRVRCRSLLSQDRAVVGSQHGVYVFQASTGRPIYQLPGHTDTVWCVAPSPNGRYLLTGSSDMTLEIWNLDRYELVVSLFVAGDEWIAWTPQGYYAASIGGEGLMGWHVNRGPDALADFFPASQFRGRFYRPDVIRRVLETGDPWSAVDAANRDRQQATSRLTIAAAIPPEVQARLLDSGEQRPAGTTSLSATARRRGDEPILGLQLIVDGRPQDFRPAPLAEHAAGLPVPLPDKFEATWNIKLPPGEHSLVVEAQTAASSQLSKPIAVHVPGPAAKPDLYVLSIAAADGAQPPLAPFAEADAASLAQHLARQSGKAYAHVTTRVLSGSQVTAANLARELEWLRNTARAEDTVVVFFAGRAAVDDRAQVQFLGSPSPSTPLGEQVLSGDALKASLARTRGHVYFWTDARWAGQLKVASRQVARVHDYCCGDLSVSRQTGAEAPSRHAMVDLLRELARPGVGVAGLAAASGRKSAQDDARQRHGLLTLSLVDGLAGRADADGDGRITWAELEQFLTRDIDTRSAGQQRPVIATPDLLPSDALVRP